MSPWGSEERSQGVIYFPELIGERFGAPESSKSQGSWSSGWVLRRWIFLNLGWGFDRYFPGERSHTVSPPLWVLLKMMVFPTSSMGYGLSRFDVWCIYSHLPTKTMSTRSIHYSNYIYIIPYDNSLHFFSSFSICDNDASLRHFGQWVQKYPGDGFKYFICSTLPQEMIQFD